MSKDVLIISTMPGVEHCAQAIAGQTGVPVEVRTDRGAGLLALKQGEYAVVVVEENLTEADPAWADQLWAQAGLALPLEINFALSGCARLGRQIKAALQRREGERAIARLAATVEIENELKSSVTGLLLQSELALREPQVPPSLEPKLRHLVELAGSIRERLDERQKKHLPAHRL